MAKYTITHTCGHTEEVQLYGSYEDRERRIAYLESIECEDCRKAKADAAVAEAKKQRVLADLQGSEKQVAWANAIRERAYQALDCLWVYAVDANGKAMLDGWKKRMDNETSAKWWIDNRNEIPTGFINATSESAANSAAREIVRGFRNLFAA